VRIKIYKKGGDLTGNNYIFPGGGLTGPLYINVTGESVNHAVNKQYVDNSINNLDAGDIVSGTISVSTLPSFTGDVVSNAGDNTLTLTTTGVIAGSYPKVEVDNKGRIINSSILLSTDIPNLDWSKITTGKPTTLSGYGITDAVNINGGVLNAFLTFGGSITDPLQAVTKQYVDNIFTALVTVKTGDIINKPIGTTPVGFLQCNGSYVDKTIYGSLYSVIGDTYTILYNGTIGSGKPWKQQYEINNLNTTPLLDITGWTTSLNTIPGLLASSQAIVTNGIVYLIGGHDGLTSSSNVYSSVINSDGTLGSWILETNALPGPLSHSQALVTKNKVYLLGGYDGTNWVSTVYVSNINADGTLGPWMTGVPLPINLSESQAVITNDRVYLIGGRISVNNYSSFVYTALIDANGNIGTWELGPMLPTPIANAQAAVIKNKLYIIGGFDGVNYLSTIYYATINTDGSIMNWNSYISLPSPIAYSQSVVTKDSIFILGGKDSTGSLSSVYNAAINVDGTLDVWNAATSLPITLSSFQLVTTSNYVALLGGFNGTSFISSVIEAPYTYGKNDYSAYYGLDQTSLFPNSFRLPDTTVDDLAYNSVSYIKT